METIWQVAVEVMREALAATPAPGRDTIGIGVTGVRAGLWPVTDQGLPSAGAAILWNDGRAADIVEAWKQDGTLTDVFRISGNVMMPGYPQPLLHWLAEHEPERRRQIPRVRLARDWLGYRLTGRMQTDPLDASYVLFDTERRVWSPEVFALCGGDADSTLLPEIVP